MVLTDLEGVVVALLASLLFRLVFGGEGNLLPVRTPGELQHAARRRSDAAGVASGHGQHAHLGSRGGLRAHLIDEGEPVAGRRPLGRADLGSSIGQDPLGAGGYVDQDQLALEPVFVVIGPRDHHDDGLPVGGESRVAQGDDPTEGLEVEPRTLGQRRTGRGDELHQREEESAESHG